MYLNDLFALLQGQFFIQKLILNLINILNIKQRRLHTMPSSHVPSMNDRWRYDYVRSRTDFQLRFKKNKLFRINLNKWRLILYLNE